MQEPISHLRDQEGQAVYIFNFLHLVKMIVVGWDTMEMSKSTSSNISGIGKAEGSTFSGQGGESCFISTKTCCNREIIIYQVLLWKSVSRWDPDKIALQDLFCAGYMLCEMVVREKETQVSFFCPTRWSLIMMIMMTKMWDGRQRGRNSGFICFSMKNGKWKKQNMLCKSVFTQPTFCVQTVLAKYFWWIPTFYRSLASWASQTPQVLGSNISGQSGWRTERIW